RMRLAQARDVFGFGVPHSDHLTPGRPQNREVSDVVCPRAVGNDELRPEGDRRLLPHASGRRASGSEIQAGDRIPARRQMPVEVSRTGHSMLTGLVPLSRRVELEDGYGGGLAEATHVLLDPSEYDDLTLGR